MTALRSSPPPALQSALPQRAKYLRALRAGDPPKRLHPARAGARVAGARDIDAAAHRRGVSNLDLALSLLNSTDRFGAEVRVGSALVGDGEIARLAPVAVAADVELERLRHVIARMLVDAPVSERTRLTMAMQHLDIVETLVFAPSPSAA